MQEKSRRREGGGGKTNFPLHIWLALATLTWMIINNARGRRRQLRPENARWPTFPPQIEPLWTPLLAKPTHRRRRSGPHGPFHGDEGPGARPERHQLRRTWRCRKLPSIESPRCISATQSADGFSRLLREGIEPNPGPEPRAKICCPHSKCAFGSTTLEYWIKHCGKHEERLPLPTLQAAAVAGWGRQAGYVCLCAVCKALFHSSTRPHPICTMCFRAQKPEALPTLDVQEDAAPIPMPTLADIFWTRVTTVPSVPRAARLRLARSLAGALRKASSDDGFVALAIWCKSALRAPLRGPRRGGLAEILVRQADAASQHPAAAWEATRTAAAEKKTADELPPLKANPRQPSRTAKGDDEDTVRRENARARHWGRIRLLQEGRSRLRSRKMHTLSEEVASKLHDLHPMGPPVDTASLRTRGEVVAPFSDDEVRKAVLGFPRESAPGPMSLQAAVLQQLTRADATGDLTSAIGEFATLAANGRMSPESLSWFAGQASSLS